MFEDKDFAVNRINWWFWVPRNKNNVDELTKCLDGLKNGLKDIQDHPTDTMDGECIPNPRDPRWTASYEDAISRVEARIAALNDGSADPDAEV